MRPNDRMPVDVLFLRLRGKRSNGGSVELRSIEAVADLLARCHVAVFGIPVEGQRAFQVAFLLLTPSRSTHFLRVLNTVEDVSVVGDTCVLELVHIFQNTTELPRRAAPALFPSSFVT